MDLSYILNSPDVERVAGALETIADKAIATMNGKIDKNQGFANAGKSLIIGNDGMAVAGDAYIPMAVQIALLQIAQHITYDDGNGAVYIAALQEAFNGIMPETYDYYWAYTMGSLTENGYELSSDHGTELIVSDGLLVKMLESGSTARTYRNPDLVQPAGKIELEFSYHHTSIVFTLSDGTNGARIRLYPSSHIIDSGAPQRRPLGITVFEGNDEVAVNDVQVSENTLHTLALEYNSGTKITLDGTVIYNTDSISTYYTTASQISLFSEQARGDTIDDCWFKLKSVKHWRI